MKIRIASKTLAMLCVAGFLAGCGSAQGPLFGPGSEVVNTPAYNQAKIFYVNERPQAATHRFSDLKEPWQDLSKDRAVKNGDPVTIIASKAYIPLSATDPSQSSVADIVGNRKTRDIAVLLDLGVKQGVDEEFIAVWYQRDVPSDSVLEFSNLPIYSIDSWNSDVSPYFRIRIMDVRGERNARTEELLKQVNSTGSLAVALAGTPAASLFFSAGISAARLILANDRNRTLMDFSFNLYSAAQIDQAGGMPLGLFKKGGMILLGMPRGAPVDYWERAFHYDFQRERVQLAGEKPGDPADTPFLMATVLTSETVVPNIVKRRSAEIVKILTNPEATVQADLAGAVEDAEALHKSLQVLSERQIFRKFPTKDSLGELITKADVSKAQIKGAERDFLLATFRTATGQTFSSLENYKKWFDACKDKYNLNQETKKLEIKANQTCTFNPT